MIRDLLTPEAHRNPYVWAAVLLAHATICLALWGALVPPLGPWWAAAAVSGAYLVAWEVMQLRTALRRGDGLLWAAADGVGDWVGVTAGVYAVACVWEHDLPAALATWAVLLIVAAVGYWRRNRA